jgi:threonine/homoserine/homoserine lactone efflux protein
MDANLLLKGFTVGLVVAVPVGPVGLLCTQRTLVRGRIHGLVSGLGAATADVIYASVAALGFTMVSDFLIAQRLLFRLLTGIFLCLLGVRAFLVKQPLKARPSEKLRHLSNYSSTLLITLAHPITILVPVAMFAGLGVAVSGAHCISVVLLAGGVFLGSMFWCVLLSILVGMFHRRITERTALLLARIFGGILTAIGIVIIIVAVV